MTLPEPVQKWIKALRSGEYKQGDKRLCKVGKDGEPNSYCCLGIACELYKEEFPDNLNRVEHNVNGIVIYHKYIIGEEEWTVSLPPVVKEWLGLKDEYGTYKKEDAFFSLMRYNDETRYTFDQIADLIEKDYELMAIPQQELAMRSLVKDLQEIAKKKTSSEIINDSGCPAPGHNHRYFMGSVDAEVKMARRLLKQLGIEIEL